MVERTEDEIFESQDFVIEPSPHFSEKSGLAMATTLVNIERRVTVPVRVMNPFSHEITIPRDSVVGTAEVGIADSDPLFEMEDEAEVENFTPVRRLKLQKVDSTEPLCTTSEVKHCSDTVPQHLSELLTIICLTIL